jgi:predicted dehydrogenase
MPLNIAIAGCGFVGTKRAQSLAGAGFGAHLAICCDVDRGRALALAAAYPGAEAATGWRAVAAAPDIDIVIVATTHDMLAPIAAAAAGAGKHVLIEKPGARRAAELEAVVEAARRTGALVRVGFNHRYHRAIQKARAIFDAGAIGPPLFVRGRYGHGGRPGYEREWRADPAVSGGGELLDQGVHLIDLAGWFLGDFTRVTGRTPSFFWKMPVEDNAFLLLETVAGQIAFLHASWTEWKNLFSFEICGRDGKLEITGLGGSYGTERLTLYKMKPEMGPPETTAWEFPMADNSWETEFAEFLEDIRLRRQPRPGIAEAQAALRVVERVYGENAT